MLRLAPTTIPLTRGEILQYEMRAEKRRQMRELLEQEDRNYVMHGGCSPDLHVDRLRPRIQRGPERRAKYYSNTHSSTSSSFNTIVNDDDATLDERSASSYARSESDIRRDSVLSSEGTGPSAPMSGPMGPLKQPRGYTADDSWINDALSSLQMPDVEHRSKQTRVSSNRRSHLRSASDPTCLSVPCMPKSESGLHRSYQRRRTVSSSSATDQENALADIDEAESSEGAHSDQRNIRQLYDRVQQCPELSRSREGISAPDPHSVCSPSRYREGFVRDITLSAVARAAKDSSSPLDQLVEDVTALSQTQWAASLPSRPRGRNDRLVRFPTFLDDDEVANTPTSQERLSASSSHTSHAYGQPQRSPGATINQPARHDLSIQPMAAGPAPVVTSGPRTPTLVGSAADGRTHTRSQMTNQRGSAIRRRPVPGAEQENEDELAPYLAERRAWLARQNEPYRGRLNRTPSPSGHLGRRLS